MIYASINNVTREDLLHEVQELWALGYEPSREGNYPTDLLAVLQQLTETHQGRTGATLASQGPAR